MIDDADIRCPLPELSPGQPYSASFGILIAFCQLQSCAHNRLFTVTAFKKTQEIISAEIDSFRNDLEAWRLSVPVEYRPGLPLRLRQLSKPRFMLTALHLHLSYYILVVAVARLDLYVSTNCNDGSLRAAKSKRILMEAARSIVNVVQLVPIEPSTPMKYELCGQPLQAHG